VIVLDASADVVETLAAEPGRATVVYRRGEQSSSPWATASDDRKRIVAIRAKLTTQQDLEARRAASQAPAVTASSPKPVITEEQKALRKERVAKAKDALARSVGLKGDHVPPARASLKLYLQRLNEPKQPDDARFEELINAPFQAPPKKKTNDRR
jgi:hypothetical protein